MQITNNTVNGWSGILAGLAAKRQASREHAESLRTQKHELALEAAMGSAEAKRKLEQINSELARLTLEAGDWEAAIARAEAEKRHAQQAASSEAERVRQEHITAAMQEYVASIQKIDETLRQLAGHFHDAKRSLDTAESYMDAQERAPVQQMPTRSLFGPTLAVARFGLGDYIQLGSQAQYREHRKTLTEYSLAFTDRYVKPDVQEAASGNQQ